MPENQLLDDGTSLLYPDNRPIRLAGLWLLTALWLYLGGLLVFGLSVGIPGGWFSLAGLPWLWGGLMRQGLRRALGPVADQPQVGLYVGFALSQIGFLLGVLLWLILSAPPDNTPWFD